MKVDFHPMEFTELIQKAVKRDRKRHGDDLIQCEHCGSTNTPLWRSGPSGPKSLCNACGLRWAKGTLRVVSKGGMAMPAKMRETPIHAKPARRPSSPKAHAKVELHHHGAACEHPMSGANELSKGRHWMLMTESCAINDSEAPALVMLRPQEMPVNNDIVQHESVRPAAMPAMQYWQEQAGQFFDHSPVDSPMMDCCTVDLPFNDIMEASDISGFLDSMVWDEPISAF